MTNHVVAYSRENGGRVLILFLLFFLAIYQFITAGFPVFAIICFLPFVVLFVYWAFKFRMFAFWSLIIVNYFIQFHSLPEIPIPMSLPNEMLQILLLSIAIIDARQTPHFERSVNFMLFALIIWCIYCTLEHLWIRNKCCCMVFRCSPACISISLHFFSIFYLYIFT